MALTVCLCLPFVSMSGISSKYFTNQCLGGVFSFYNRFCICASMMDIFDFQMIFVLTVIMTCFVSSMTFINFISIAQTCHMMLAADVLNIQDASPLLFFILKVPYYLTVLIFSHSGCYGDYSVFIALHQIQHSDSLYL